MTRKANVQRTEKTVRAFPRRPIADALTTSMEEDRGRLGAGDGNLVTRAGPPSWATRPNNSRPTRRRPLPLPLPRAASVLMQ